MMYCKAAGYIAGTENRLDAAVLKKIRREFGMSIRSPRFNQVLFGALGDLFARSGLDKDSFDKSAGLIVGSRLGPVGMVSAFQDEILDYPEDQVMAGTFANSVHNAPAGAVTVLLDVRGPAFSVMGFEDMLVNFLLEPEDMMDLCNAIGEYRFQLTKLIVDHLHPDIILSHDDWGSKQALFVSPDTWREFIKPQYEKSYKYMKDHGVIVMHHADSFMEPIVEDMVDLGIDIWQGTLPQNDIVKLQKQLAGRMTLMGGIDASIVDRVDSTEEEIRKEVRRACEEYAPGGHFIPCITYGGPGCLFPHVDPIIDDEIAKYNKEVYGI